MFFAISKSRDAQVIKQSGRRVFGSLARHSFKASLFLSVTVGLASLVASCNGGSVSEIGKIVPPKPVATPDPQVALANLSLKVLSGDGQSAVSGSTFSQTLRVVLLDEASNPKPGELINFAVVSAGTSTLAVTDVTRLTGTATAGGASATATGTASTLGTATTATDPTLSETSVVTDGLGVAETAITAGSTVGTITVKATLGTTTKSVTFSLKSVDKASVPAPVVNDYELQIVAGNFQSGLPSQLFPVPLKVQLVDNGKALVGEMVTFSATGFNQGGSFSSASTTTDASGFAQTSFTPGPIPRSLEVDATWTSNGLTRTAAFSLETIAVNSLPISLSIISGDNQIATPGALFAQPLKVQLLNNSLPMTGETITFSTAEINEGTFTAAGTATDPEVTDASGFVQTSFTAGADPRSIVVIATWAKDGQTKSASFNLQSIPPDQLPVTFSVVSGNNQTTHVGQPFPTDLRVQLINDGTPMSNQLITFSLFDSTVGSLKPVSVATDFQGFAETTLTASGIAANIVVLATWQNGAVVKSVSFNETSIPFAQQLVAMDVVAGNYQTGLPGVSFPVPLKVQLLSGGLPFAGQTVSFSGQGFAVGTLSPTTVQTDSSGFASTTFTPGPVAQTMAVGAAWQDAISGQQVSATFNLQTTSVTNLPITLTVAGGNNQTTLTGHAFPQPLNVQLLNGTVPMAGESVVFSVADPSQGSFAATPVTTDPSGFAQTTFTAGNSAGAVVVTASWTNSGQSKTATFNLTSTAPSATVYALNIVGGNFQTWLPGVTFAQRLKVQLLQNGVPLAGAPITWTVAGFATGTFDNTPAVTDASGYVDTAFTPGPVAQAMVVNATYSGSGQTAVAAFNLETRTIDQLPIALNIISGNNQTATVGAAFTQPLQIQLLNNAVGMAGQTIVFALNNSTYGTLGSATAVTDVSGYASTTVTASGTPETISVTASWTEGTQTISKTFGLVSVAQQLSVYELDVIQGNFQIGLPSVAFPSALRVQLLKDGQPLANAPINFSPEGFATGSFSVNPVTTDSSGYAEATFTPGAVTQAMIVDAAYTGNNQNLVAKFNLETRAINQLPIVLNIAGGNNQQQTVGLAFSAPLKVQLLNNALPMTGETISFAVADATTGTLSRASVVTDSSGYAQTMFTAGLSPSSITVTASWGISGQSLSSAFTLASIAANQPVINLAVISGNYQIGLPGAAFASSLRVQLTKNGVPMPGQAVTYATQGFSTGTFGVSPATTDSSGYAETSFTPGSIPQAISITATWQGSGGQAATASFSLLTESIDLLPIALTPVTGNNQSTTVATAFPTKLKVQLTNSNAPMAGEIISFSLNDPTTGTFDQSSVTTDASGFAQTGLTAGAVPASIVVTATWIKGTQQKTTTFNLTSVAAAQPVINVTIVSGNYQIGVPGAAFAQPLKIQLLKDGQPMPGESIAFSVEGFGSGSFGTAVATVDANGFAQSTFTPGPIAQSMIIDATWQNGGQTATAKFNLQTETIDQLPFSLTVVAGNGQAASVGTAFATSLKVQLLNNNLPLANETIVFSVSDPSLATILAASVTTDASGFAQTSVVAGAVPQAIPVTATWTKGNQQKTASFSLTSLALTQPVINLAVVSGNFQTGLPSVVFPSSLKVLLTKNGTPMAGEVIAYALQGFGTGTFAPSASVTTDASGNAQVTFTPGATPQTMVVNAVWQSSVSDQVGSQTATASFNLETRTIDQLPIALNIISGNNQTGTVGTTFATPLKVQLLNNAVPQSGQVIAFQVSGSLGTVDNAAVTTDASGYAQTNFTAGTTPSNILVTASWTVGTQIKTSTFTLTSQSAADGVLVNMNVISGNYQTGLPNAAFPSPLKIQLMQNGVPFAGQTVTYSTEGFAAGTFAPSAVITTDSQGFGEVTFTPGSITQTMIVDATWQGSGKTVVANFNLETRTIDQLPYVLSIVSGNNQTGVPSTVFPQVLKVQLLNNAVAVVGETIQFSVTNPSLGTFQNAVPVTDSQGFAQTSFTPGATPSSITITATWVKGSSQLSAVFYLATVPPTQLYQLTVVSGNFQTGLPSVAFPQPLKVLLQSSGVPLANQTITFAPQGFAAGTFDYNVVTTDANGNAQVVYTPGPLPQAIDVGATYTSGASSVVADFSLQTIPLDQYPVTLNIVSGNSQSGLPGTQFLNPLKVQLLNNSLPMAGETITFSTDGGDQGSFTTPSSVTDVNGFAQTYYTPGLEVSSSLVVIATWTKGSQQKTVAFNFATLPISQLPILLNVAGGNNQIGTPSVAFPVPLNVQLLNNQFPDANQTITFATAGANQGTFSVSSVQTDASGFAKTVFTPGPVAGSMVVIASWASGGQTINASFNLQTLPPSPAATVELVVVSGDFQTGQPSATYPAPLKVQLLQNGVGYPTQPVVFANEGFSKGTFLPASVMTDASGFASVTYTPDATPRSFNVSATWTGTDGTTRVVEFNLETTPPAVTPPPPFAGCVSGRAIDISRIQINFQQPAGSDFVRLYRNGIIITEIRDQTVTSYIDSGLDEGQTYLYSCRAVWNGNEFSGTNTLSIATIIEDAPIFAGVTSAMAVDGHSVALTWKSAKGVAATTFQVFATVGNSADFTQTVAVATANLGDEGITVTGLGDELPYTFYVHACTTNNICDANTAVATATTLDGGAPVAVGATAAAISNGSIVVTAPWVPANGLIATRKVYMKTGAGDVDTNLADYNLLFTTTVANPLYPPQALTIANLVQGFTYNFIVVDTDDLGQSSTNRSIASITVLDITPPLFLGIGSLTHGAATDTQIVAGWTALNGENNDPNGAAIYELFMTSAAYPAVPSDPCQQTTPLMTVDGLNAKAGDQYSQLLDGLSQRNTYRVCVKAIDLAGNTSITTTSLTITTLDVTPPQFDGLKSIVYDQTYTDVVLGWDASLSPDINQYVINVWKNKVVPSPSDISVIVRGPTFGTGTTLSTIEFPVTDSDVVYAVVYACDNANVVPGGTDNCSPYDYAKAITLQIPDTTPPPGFPGIAGTLVQGSPFEGALDITWGLPTDAVMGTKYAGFIIYSVDAAGGLTFLSDANCLADGYAADCHSPVTTGGPPLHYTKKRLTGLDAARTYLIHVRAYDPGGNITPLVIASHSDYVKTLDQTPPVMGGGLTFGAAPTYALSWIPAIDNQYPAEPGNAITYRLYRKEYNTFANPTAPYLDGQKVAETNATTFTDPASLDQGAYYYYTLCALDSSGNESCDGITKSRVIPDYTPPTLTGLTLVRTGTQKTWGLIWASADNVAVVQTRIYQSLTTTGPGTPSESSPLVASGDGSLMSLGGLRGPSNTDAWVNYLVVVSDAAGNQASGTVSTFSNNFINITSVTRAFGDPAGGKWIDIIVSGITANAVVLVGGLPCQTQTFLGTNEIWCLTPPASSGPGHTSLTVGDDITGGIATDSGGYQAGYTYQTTYTATTPCDNSASWGAAFAAGSGTALSPFQICTAGQLANVGLAAYANKGYYFSLRDNLDLSTAGITPMGRSGLWFHFEGNNYTLQGYSYAEPTQTQINTGLFGNESNALSTFQDLRLVNFQLSGGSGSMGALFGSCAGTISNINYANITLTSVINVGGICGIGTNVSMSGITGSNIALHLASYASSPSFFGGVLGQGTGSTPGTTLSSATVNGVTFNVTTSVSGVGGMIGSVAAGQTALSYATAGNLSLSTIGQGLGGLIGYIDGSSLSIDHSSTAGSLTGGTYKGGLVGGAFSLTGPINVATSASSVIITGSSQSNGGLIGFWDAQSGSISNSYFNGFFACTATGQCNTSTGGLIGNVAGHTLSIKNSYVSGGMIFTSTATSASLVGAGSSSSNVTVTDSFWYYDPLNLNNGTGLAQGLGTGVGSTVGGTLTASFGEPLATMSNINTYLNAGWDFTGETVNGTADLWTTAPKTTPFPVLTWQGLP